MVDCYVVDITENALKDLEGHMDYLIEKEGQKIDLLSSAKRGLLQQLFI